VTPKCEEFLAANQMLGVNTVDVAEKLWHELSAPEQHYIIQYYICIDNGCSPKLADMLASQTPPGAMTDNVFLEGHCNGNQFEKHQHIGDGYKRLAEQHGVNPKGKVYKPGLARFPGDPEAWVEGRADVERICRRRGWSCEGAVNVTPTEAGRLPGKKRGSFAKRLHEAGLPVGGA
jgi:hypothetical protein